MTARAAQTGDVGVRYDVVAGQDDVRDRHRCWARLGATDSVDPDTPVKRRVVRLEIGRVLERRRDGPRLWRPSQERVCSDAVP